MVPVTVRYPLDPSGVSPNNLVQGELHTLIRRKVRSIATTYGAFYAQSMRVVDVATNKELVRNTQFETVEMYEIPTAKFGKEVCAIVLITDESVGDQISLQYQAVGGEYSASATAVLQLIDALELDTRPVAWVDLAHKPDGFAPAMHLHDIGDTYGWEFIVNALERLQNAINLGDRLNHDAIYRYFDLAMGNLNASLVAQISLRVSNAMAAHLAAADPHPQYLLKTDTSQISAPPVRTPTNVSPAAGALNTSSTPTFQVDQFQSLYSLAQTALQIQVARDSAFTDLVMNATVNGPGKSSITSIVTLSANAQYYWRGRYQDAENTWSAWSNYTNFTTSDFGVSPPAITAPVNDSTIDTVTPTLTATPFVAYGAADTHESTDWEIWTGVGATGTRIFSSLNDTVNKTSITVPANKLNTASYWARVRYRGVSGRVSNWSAENTFYIVLPTPAPTPPPPVWPTVLGQSYGGGYWAGDMAIGGTNYVVVVAPKASGEISRKLDSGDVDRAATSRTDSVGNTTKHAAGGEAAAVVRTWNIGGFNDWQIPAIDVLNFIASNLAPGLASTPAVFKTGGAEAFEAVNYSSSTQYNRTESGSTGGDPIYGNVTVRKYWKSGGGDTEISPGDTFEAYMGFGKIIGTETPGDATPGYVTRDLGATWIQPTWNSEASYLINSGWIPFNRGYKYGPLYAIPGQPGYSSFFDLWAVYNNVPSLYQLDPAVVLSDRQVYHKANFYRDVVTTGIVGYTPTESWSNTYYEGKIKHFGTLAEGVGSKTNAYRVRGIRLIAKT